MFLVSCRHPHPPKTTSGSLRRLILGASYLGRRLQNRRYAEATICIQVRTVPYTPVLGDVAHGASREDACVVLHHANVCNGPPETATIFPFPFASSPALNTQELVNFNGGRMQPQSPDPKHMLVFRVEIGGHMVGCPCRSVEAAPRHRC